MDRSAHPHLNAPRVIVAPSLPMLSLLAGLKARGVRLALATASARQRVDWLFARLPVMRELFGEAVMAAEDLAMRAVEAAEGPRDGGSDLWRLSAAAHAARPFSLAAKTPWALAPVFGGEAYDLLIDDSEVTADLLTRHGLGARLHKVPGDAFTPERGWDVVAGVLARLAGRPLRDGERAAMVQAAPETGILRMEDPLYLPLMHRHDQFRWETSGG